MFLKAIIVLLLFFSQVCAFALKLDKALILDRLGKISAPSKLNGDCCRGAKCPLYNVDWAENLGYDVRCTSNNDYLEEGFKKAWSKAEEAGITDGRTIDQILSTDFARCIGISQGFRVGVSCTGDNYLHKCTSNDEAIRGSARIRTLCKYKGKRRRKRHDYYPCISPMNVATVAVELERAMRCAGLDDHTEIMGNIHHESRFVPNIISSNGAGGYGQLTRGAINMVNNRQNNKEPEEGGLGGMNNFAKSAKNKGCGYLKDVHMSSKQTGLCRRIFIPSNPRNNLVYTMFFWARYKRLARKAVKHVLGEIGRKWRIPEKELIYDLLRLGYNTGELAFDLFKADALAIGGKLNSREEFRKYLKDRLIPMTVERDMEKRIKRINKSTKLSAESKKKEIAYLEQWKPKRIKELIKYLPLIIKEGKDLNRKAGLLCTKN